MKEDFLHYIWKFKKFHFTNIVTRDNASVEIISVGEHNLNAGPDFFNAQLRINQQHWAGNVEIHVKSSDWFLHNHEQDKAYDNVILHVVWEHDVDIYRKDNSVISTLQLKDYVSHSLLDNYNKLFIKEGKWINCEKEFHETNDFVLNNWLERLYLERLERKHNEVVNLLKESQNDWEAVLFKMITKNFGLKVNGDSFFSLAQALDFSVIRKNQDNLLKTEALLLGQAGLLTKDIQEPYYLSLVNEYAFLKQKHNLSNASVLPINFFRLRPSNFPTIRLAQLAKLYHVHQNLFSKIIHTESLADFHKLFKVSASAFWETHYTFEKESKPLLKNLTNSFVDLLLINTILPLKFSYAKFKGVDKNETVLELVKEIDSENNSVVEAFKGLKNSFNTALESQALLQLKTEYCNKNKCLQCAIGSRLLTK